ncbi:MAG: abortive infection family protein [Candidatus Thiodiazotropha endolucinida]
MSDSEFFLASSTRAIVGMDDAVHLLEQKERVEQSVVAKDAALTLDTAKSFLESVFKTILSDRIEGPNLEQDMSPLYRNVRDVLPLNRDADVANILKRLTNSVVHNVAELRNNYGAASHGDDGFYENPIDMVEAKMIAHFVDGMTGFLIQKHRETGDPELAARIYYNDHSEFNDYLDAQRDSYEIVMEEDRTITLTPSYLLFTADEDAYRELLVQYLTAKKEEEVEVETVVETEALTEKAAEVLPEIAEIPVEEGIQQIKASILVSDEARMSVNNNELQYLAEWVIDFAKNKAGIDWQNRDSLRARFRTLLRREFIKVTFSEAFMDYALDSVIEMAAELYPSRMEAIE